MVMKDFKKGKLGWIYVGKPFKPQILDVGCGTNPKGDVNIDYRVGLTFETTRDPKGDYLDTKRIENFVKGDVLHLPFKPNSFEEVYSSHVIEHVRNPYKLLKEMIRVSKKTIEIKCPHRYGRFAKGHIVKGTRVHKHFFSLTWFNKTIKALAPHSKVLSTVRHNHPIPFLGLIQLPHEIHVIIYK